MSKFNLEVPFTAFKGKVCKHSKIILKKVRQTNFTSQICIPRTKPFTEAELARQNKFRQAARENFCRAGQGCEDGAESVFQLSAGRCSYRIRHHR